MKSALYLLVMLGTAPLWAQVNSQSADEQVITALEQQIVQMDITNHYNQRFIRAHVDRKLIAVSPVGFLRIDDLVKPSEGPGHCTPPPTEEKLTDVAITFYGDTAVVHAKVYKKGKDPFVVGKSWEEHGFLLHTWVKQKGRWQLVSSATGPFLEIPPHID